MAAEYFAQFHATENLLEILADKRFQNMPQLILGSGSNVLFTKNREGIVLKNEIKSEPEIVREDENFVYIKVGSAMSWHKFVMYCVSNNYGGVENLSLIPGTVGAGPIQNIGAYGVELKDVFYELEALHLHDKNKCTFSAMDCKFGYRNSVFKNICKNKFAILNVTYRLTKKPVVDISYGAIKSALSEIQIDNPTIQHIAQVIVNIRTSKLPDPKMIGSAGSFFKNPEISNSHFLLLQKKIPTIVGFPTDSGNIKLAAGYLIEQCGWKGYRKNDVGCYSKQALVLINYGNASGQEVISFAQEIIESVYAKFGVHLEAEVNVL